MRCLLAPSLLPAALLVTTSLLSAQGVVPPFQLSQLNPRPSLGTGVVPGTDVQQVHMVHVAGDPPNIYLCGMTVTALPAANGGVGGTDVLSGRYDAVTDTFTPDLFAAAFNTTGTEFGLTFDPTGLHAVIDRLPGFPVIASRPNTNSPFVIVGNVSGLPTQSYYDPSLAYYHGVPQLLHVFGTDIAMSPISLTTAALTGPSVTVVFTPVAGATANSPTPVCDSQGEIIGISHHSVLAADNDHYMSLDLNPATGAVLMNNTTTWTNNGGFCGGRFFDAEYTPAPYHIFSIDTFWCTGGRAPVGGSMEVRAMTPPTASASLFLSYLLIGGGFSAAGTPITGINGFFGLSSVWVAAAMPLHDNNNGESLLTFAVPNTPSLNGAVLACQSLTVDLIGGQATFGNTAAMVIN